MTCDLDVISWSPAPAREGCSPTHGVLSFQSRCKDWDAVVAGFEVQDSAGRSAVRSNFLPLTPLLRTAPTWCRCASFAGIASHSQHT